MSRSFYKKRAFLKARKMNTRSEQEESAIQIAVHGLLKFMYDDQRLAWNRQLSDLSSTNAEYYNRSETYAIYFEGSRYQPLPEWEFEDVENPFCLPLHPDHPELHEKMRLIAFQLGQIRKEREAVKRFIVGLFHLKITKDQFVSILGDNLLEACHRSLWGQILDTSNSQSLFQVDAIKRYTEDNKDIVDLIGERRLINLVLQ